MKAHLAKVSLALLSTVFLLGCQEQGSGPIGPEDPQFDKPGFGECEAAASGDHCHDDDVVDPDPITLTLADGMQQATAFPVEVSKDTRKTLKVSNHNFTKPTITMNFASVGTCEGFVGTNGGTLPDDDELAALEAQLTKDAADAKVVMSIGKTSLGGSGHSLLVQYIGDLGNTVIMLGGWPGPVNVAEGTTDVFTFTGPVVVWDREGNVNDERLISCPGAEVVVTLTR